MRIIKVLTNKDAKHFNKEAPKYEVVIAGFFMVNCPACDAFKPEWNNFVKSCEHKDEPRVLIAEVDSNHASNVDFDTSALEGFPTVYRDVKRDHGVEEFKKERSAKALHHFLKEAIAAKKKAHKREHMHGGKRRKTRKKRKTRRRKRRKSRRKKKKGGVINSCASVSLNDNEETRQEADRYCQTIEGTKFAKCNLSGEKGQCQKLSQDEINLLMYIDPNDARIANRKSQTSNNPMSTRVQQLRSSSDALKPYPLVRSPPRVQQLPSSSSNVLKPSPLVRSPARVQQLRSSDAPKPSPLVRSPARGQILSPPTFEYQFGTFTPEDLKDTPLPSSGGKRKLRRKKTKKRKTRRRKRRK